MTIVDVSPSRRLFGGRTKRVGIPRAVRKLFIVITLLLAWQIYVSMSHVSPFLLKGPVDVITTFLHDMFISRTLPPAMANTFKVLAVGTALGLLFGLVLAIFASVSSLGDDILQTVCAMANPLPPVSLLPLAMLWFGITTNALLVVLIHATVWPIATGTSVGFRTVQPTLRMVAQNLGLRGFRLAVRILLPAALPHILNGLRTGWAFGWRTIIASELVFGVAGGSGGLGWYINQARFSLNTSQVLAGLVTIAILGVIIEFLFGLVERRTVVRWGMQQ